MTPEVPGDASAGDPGRTPAPPTWPDALLDVLAEARARHFLGPVPIDVHLDHASAWLGELESRIDGRARSSWVDLGSGAGVPGLMAAARWPDTRGVLVESQHKRAQFLERACRRLGWDGRVRVIRRRAEEVGHQEEHREGYGLVLARAFGPPATTAECAAGLVAVGGHLSVSEPPGSPAPRWDPEGLARLGFGAPEAVPQDVAPFVLIRKTETTDDDYPRRVGVPRKRPLW